MDMTKFEDVNDPGFIAVAGELRRWSKELAQSIAPSLTSITKAAQMSASVSSPDPQVGMGSHDQRPQVENLAPTLPLGPQTSDDSEAQGGVSGNAYRGVPTIKYAYFHKQAIEDTMY